MKIIGRWHEVKASDLRAGDVVRLRPKRVTVASVGAKASRDGRARLVLRFEDGEALTAYADDEWMRYVAEPGCTRRVEARA